AIGAALVLLGCTILISTFLPRVLVTTITVLLIGGCFVAQLYQFDKYNRIYATITRPILSAVLPFISQNANYHVLINDYGFLSGTWDLGLELQVAVGYLLPRVQAAHIFVCESSSGRLLPRANGPLSERGYCQQTEHSFAVAEPRDAAMILKDAAIGALGPDGTISIDGTKRTIKARLPIRAAQLFSLSRWDPAHSMFRARERPDLFECRFDSMWGYAVPCRTFGFYDALPYRTDLNSSYAWIGEQRSGLIFDIEPNQGRYQVLIEILDRVSPAREFKMKLNGSDLFQLSDSSSVTIKAVFASDLLQKKNNVLEFYTELNKELGLSFAIKAILVRPLLSLEPAQK